MSPLNYARLSLMMFVQFFLWGAWYVMGPSYLETIGFKGNDFGWMYSVGPIAGIISPFFVGMIADRFFSTERVLGVMHLLGAAAMFGATLVMTATFPEPKTPEAIDLATWRPALVNLLFFAHMLCYFPTLSLTNTLAMHTMTDSEKQFPLIRVFGTIGWIVGNNILTLIAVVAAAIGQTETGIGPKSIHMFYVAAGSGVVMGLYSFLLPHTPPPSAGKRISAREILGLDALVLLKRPAYLAFMVSSFLICIPLAFYYQLAARTVDQGGFAAPATIMSLGQVSEIFFMLVMPLCFARLGVKWMLFVGMLAWVARYTLFMFGAPAPSVWWMLLIGVVLHGICYDFFFVTGQIYTDQVAPSNIRGQAQGMLVLFTLGIGMLIGAQIAGRVETAFTPNETGWLQEEAGAVGKAVAKTGEDLEAVLKDADAAERSGYEDYVKKSAGTMLDGWKRTLLGSPDDAKRTKEFVTLVGKETEAEQKAIEEAQEKVEKLKKEEKPNLKKPMPKAEDEDSPLKIAQKKVADLLDAKVKRIVVLADQAAKVQYESLAEGPTLAEAYKLGQRKSHLASYQQAKSVEASQLKDWRTIWMIPAIFAGVIMVLFVLVFHDAPKKAA